jgi:hypothetical protein
VNRIAELGDRILRFQADVGMENPRHYNPGLSQSELAESPLLQEVPFPSELHELYGWKNGVLSGTQIPMGCLWLIPGFFMYSLQNALSWNQDLASGTPDWKPSWYPLLSRCSSDYYFFDRMQIVNGRVPILYYDPEFSPGLWQIYDNLESMFTTIWECYQHGGYFVNAEGYLDSDARKEAEISKQLNPNSDHWLRKDLHRS